jgi:hypothetical protein
MAMTKCAECERPISTLAPACPSCGAPAKAVPPVPAQQPQVRRPFKIAAAVVFSVLALAVVIAAVNSPKKGSGRASDGPGATTGAADPSTLTPPAPAHRYAFHQGYTYGYAREVSATDTAAGLATVPLELVIYGGKSGQTYSFGQMVNTSVSRQMSCREPCENMVVNESAYGGFQQQVIPVVPGSVLAAMVEDARNGMLTPYVR